MLHNVNIIILNILKSIHEQFQIGAFLKNVLSQENIIRKKNLLILFNKSYRNYILYYKI